MVLRNYLNIKQFRYFLQALVTAIFLFAANPGYAGYYGRHHYGGHYYGYGHGHYGAHFSYHGHGHGSALGYALLGLTGVVLLAHLFDHSDYYPRRRYVNPYAYQPTVVNVPTRQIVYPVPQNVVSNKTTVPRYGSKEGWDSLNRGDTERAQDIFAVQSQQQLNSGIPKIGFALAVSMNGDLDRGTRSMRRALRVDADAIQTIKINKDLEKQLARLTNDYQSRIHDNSDNSFMIAAISFLQRDYKHANEAINIAIASGDNNQSTLILQELIDYKL